MGFWQGMNEGLTYVLDKRAAEATEERAYAFKREEYQKTLLAAYQDRYIQQLAEKTGKKAAMQAELSAGIKLGLTDTNALVLQRTGELSLFLEQYEKNKKVDKKYVEDLNLTVTKYLEEAGDEVISTALINGVSTDRDTTDPEQSAEALAEAIYNATSLEELQRLGEDVYAPVGVTSMEPLDLNFNYVSGPDFTDTKAMKNQIASALQTQFADSFAVNERTGDITVSSNAAPEVANLFALAEQRAGELAYSPQSTLSPTQAAAFVTDQIRTAVTVGNIGAQALVDNFDAVLTDPKTFAESFVQSPPPAPVVPVVPVNPTDTEEELQGLITGTAESTLDSIVDENMGLGQ